MKRLSLLFVAFLAITSCNSDDDQPTNSTNGIVGTWRLDRFETISGADKKTILEIEGLDICEAESTFQFTSDNRNIVKKFDEDDNGECTPYNYNVKYSYDQDTNLLTIFSQNSDEDPKEFKVFSISQNALILDNLNYYDQNDDGVIDIDRTYYVRK